MIVTCKTTGCFNLFKRTTSQKYYCSIDCRDLCSLDGCENPVKSNGYCEMHDKRIRITGDPGPIGRVKSPDGTLTHGTPSGYTHGACRCDECREAYKAYTNTPNQRERIKKSNRERRAGIKKMTDEYKLEKGCTDCGYNRFAPALHFDHIDPSTKTTNVSHMTASTPALVWAEIEKCVVRCVNCHALRTHGEETTGGSQARSRALRLEVNQFKTSNGCTDCGFNSHASALQFDHRNPEEKLYVIGTMIWSKPTELVWQEIAKCDVRCGNCHAEKTHEYKG